MKFWQFLILIIANIVGLWWFGQLTGKWGDAENYAWGGITTAILAYTLFGGKNWHEYN